MFGFATSARSPGPSCRSWLALRGFATIICHRLFVCILHHAPSHSLALARVTPNTLWPFSSSSTIDYPGLHSHPSSMSCPSNCIIAHHASHTPASSHSTTATSPFAWHRPNPMVSSIYSSLPRVYRGKLLLVPIIRLLRYYYHRPAL